MIAECSDSNDRSSARRYLEAVVVKFQKLNPDFEVSVFFSSFASGPLMRFQHRRESLKSVGFINSNPVPYLAAAELVQTVLKDGPKYGIVVTEKREPRGCPACGAMRVFIRGRVPGDKQREVCPTCVVEQLEQIITNIFSHEAKQAK